MPYLREVREGLLLAHSSGFVDDEEFLFLFDVNTSSNPDFHYWKYNNFDLDELSDDECKANFRLLKNDVYCLHEALNMPNEILR